MLDGNDDNKPTASSEPFRLDSPDSRSKHEKMTRSQSVLNLIQGLGRDTLEEWLQATTKDDNNETDNVNMLVTGEESLDTTRSKTLYGRDAELKMLVAAYDRVVSKASSAGAQRRVSSSAEFSIDEDDEASYMSVTGRSEIVLVHGLSGCGKSALVDALKRHISKDDCYFVSGKYDQLQKLVPLQAIVQAANELCTRIAADKAILFKVRKRLKRSLGLEQHKLMSLIPNLSHVLLDDEDKTTVTDIPVQQDDDDDDDDDRVPMITAQAVPKVMVLCRSFFRAAASEPSRPVVMFIDDLQWADDGSLEIIRALVSDKLSRHMLLVCSYRDDEMGHKARFVRRAAASDSSTNTSNASASHFSIQSTDVLLKNLPLEPLNDLVADCLSLDATDTWELSQVVLKKTNGNPYFVLQFLGLLQKRGSLLKVSSENGSAHFDIKRIEQEMEASQNVVDILTERVMTLPDSVQGILKLASFLGFRFRTDILETIVHSELYEPEASSSSLETASVSSLGSVVLFRERIIRTLGVAQREGLLQKLDEKNYVFSHDGVQQCFNAMIPTKEERQLLHLRIGKILWDKLNDKGSSSGDRAFHEEMFFLAVDNMNRGSDQISNREECYDLADINLDAAHWATQKNAFFAAVRYIRHGVALLDEHSWERRYKLCLGLYSAGAQLEHATASFVRSSIMIGEVHRNAKTFPDRLPVFMTEVTTLGSRGDVMGAIRLACSILKRVGCSMPVRPNPIHLVSEFIQTRHAVRKRKDQDVMNLPAMKDHTKMVAMRLMSLVVLFSYLCGEKAKLLFAVCLLRMARYTIHHGLCDLSPQGIAGYGIVQAGLGALRRADRYGKLSLKMIAFLEAPDMESRTLLLVYSLLMFQTPLPHAADQFYKSYQVGLAYGDIDYAYFGAHAYVTMACLAGRPLVELEEQCRHFASEMEEFHLNVVYWALLSTWQYILNYLGRSRHPTDLVGEALTPQFRFDIVSSETRGPIAGVHTYEMWLAYAFADVGKMMERVDLVRAFAPSVEGHFAHKYAMTNMGLACFSIYRLTAKRRYLAQGRKVIKYFSRLVKKGSVHGMPPLGLLQAERLACNRHNDRDRVEKAYLCAIDGCVSGHAKDLEGSAYERLGITLLGYGEQEKAKKYILKSLQLYQDWGADGKVQDLQQRYNKLLSL